MPSVNTVSISSLGLASDGKYHINGIENPIYLIDKNCDIVVEEDSIVVLLDTLLESKVNVLGLKNSLINYYVLNSKCSKRSFDINGEINYLEIAIGDINEALNVNLLNENSKVLAKVLSIADKANAKFVERIDHKVKNTESNITNVGVSMNSAGIVFDTTGKIDKGMSGSKCSQLSRGIVMDDDSFIVSGNLQLPDMKTLQRKLNKVENDLGFMMTYKDLRNTFKERCIQSGMNIYGVMEIMGISNMKFTLTQDKYSSYEDKRHEINKLSK